MRHRGGRPDRKPDRPRLYDGYERHWIPDWPLDRRFRLSERLTATGVKLLTKLPHLTSLDLGDNMSNKHNIRFGEGAKNTSINIGSNIESITAGKIENSFNRGEEIEKKNPEVGKLLRELSQQVADMAGKLSNAGETAKAEQVGNDLETLSNELASDHPRRKWYELSIDGLCEAGQDIGEVGATAIATAQRLLKLLVGSEEA